MRLPFVIVEEAPEREEASDDESVCRPEESIEEREGGELHRTVVRSFFQ